MEYFGEPPEINPDIAQIQARQAGAASEIQAAQLPATAFVASINGQGGNLIFQAGTVSAGLSVTFTSGPGTVSLSITGIDPIATKKSNLNAGADPTVNDDSGDGYGIGSIWTTATKAFIALDVTVGAANWLQIG